MGLPGGCDFGVRPIDQHIKGFEAMGGIGAVVAIVFFIMVTFAALTSSVSIMEAVVASFMDKFHMERKKATLVVSALALVLGFVVCLGYNVWKFSLVLPNGTVAQILDVMDYMANYILMPVVAIGTCILVGWVVMPKPVIDEITFGGIKFGREKLYVVMIKFVTPVMLLLLLAQALGLLV